MRLSEDIESDLSTAESVLKKSHERLGYTRTLIESLKDKSVVESEPNQFVNAMSQSSSRMSFRSNGFTFLELQTNGDLNLIPQLVRRSLFEYHEMNNRLNQFESYAVMAQTEALRRFAGILLPDQLANDGINTNIAELDIKAEYSVEEALGVYSRFLAEDDAINWLNVMTTAHITNIGRTQRIMLAGQKVQNLLLGINKE